MIQNFGLSLPCLGFLHVCLFFFLMCIHEFPNTQSFHRSMNLGVLDVIIKRRHANKTILLFFSVTQHSSLFIPK